MEPNEVLFLDAPADPARAQRALELSTQVDPARSLAANLMRCLHEENVPFEADAWRAALADVAAFDLDDPLPLVRARLAPLICHALTAADGTLVTLYLSETWERAAEAALRPGPMGPYFDLPPAWRAELLESLADALEDAGREYPYPPALVTSVTLRSHVRTLLAPRFPGLVVLSRAELCPTARLVVRLVQPGVKPVEAQPGFAYPESEFAFLEALAPEQVADLLLQERPATAASVLGVMNPGYADMVLQFMAPEVQEDLITRLQTQPPLPSFQRFPIAQQLRRRLGLPA